MSKNFFVTNLAKAFEERTFDLDSLFSQGDMLDKDKFDNLISSKRKQVSDTKDPNRIGLQEISDQFQNKLNRCDDVLNNAKEKLKQTSLKNDSLSLNKHQNNNQNKSFDFKKENLSKSNSLSNYQQQNANS